MAYIGQNLNICQKLDVHGIPMADSKAEKYLGDVISHDGKNDDNLKDRTNKAWGIVSQILAIIDEVPFGKHEIEAALIMRNSMFINGILTNIEVRYGLKKEYLESLEKIDEYLLRKIFKRQIY